MNPSTCVCVCVCARVCVVRVCVEDTHICTPAYSLTLHMQQYDLIVCMHIQDTIKKLASSLSAHTCTLQLHNAHGMHIRN